MESWEVIERLEYLAESLRYEWWSYASVTVDEALKLIKDQAERIECLEKMIKESGIEES